MASIQQLRRLAAEAEARAEDAASGNNTTSTAAQQHANEPLPAFTELLAINQAEIDVIETEIHNLTTAYKKNLSTGVVTATAGSTTDSGDATTTPTPALAQSAILSAWLKLINIHQHMVSEASKVVAESGVMDAEESFSDEEEEGDDANADNEGLTADSATTEQAAITTVEEVTVMANNDDDAEFSIEDAPTAVAVSTPKPQQQAAPAATKVAAVRAPKKKTAAKKPLPPAAPLLVEAYNSINITYERAIRAMNALGMMAAAEGTTTVASTSTSPANLLALMLTKKPLTTAATPSEAPATAATTSPTAILTYKLWRLYLSARIAQCLKLRMPMKRVLYPLFERAVVVGGGDASSPSAPAAVVPYVRLWTDYCDLCLHLEDYTKLRLVLQKAFDAMATAAQRTKLWQYVRHRVFGLGLGAAGASTTTKVNATALHFAGKMVAESIVLAAVEKAASVEYAHRMHVLAARPNPTDGKKKTIAPPADALALIRPPASIPRAVLLLFWAEYVAAYPTQRTNTEYLNFLSVSVGKSVDALNALEDTMVGPVDDSTPNASLIAARDNVLYYAKAYLNFVVTRMLAASTTPAAASGGATPAATTADVPSVTPETWEMVVFALQTLMSLAASSSSSTSQKKGGSGAITQREVRGWVEGIVSGIEKADFAATAANNKAPTKWGFKKPTGGSNSTDMTAIHVLPLNVKVDLLFGCAVALAQFALFDEAYELLWEYVVKAKGAYGRVETYQRVFAFITSMLQSLAGQAAAKLAGGDSGSNDKVSSAAAAPDSDDAAIVAPLPDLTAKVAEIAAADDDSTNNAASSSVSLNPTAVNRLTTIATTAMTRLEAITTQYDRIRLDIVLRHDKRNVEAWQDKIMAHRDGLANGTVTREEVKRVYLQAIQALSSLAAATSTAAGASAAAPNAAAELLQMVDAGVTAPSKASNATNNSPSLTADALAAVVEIYEDYAHFLYHHEKDYDGLKAFLRQSILGADFGIGKRSTSAAEEDENARDDEDDEDGEGGGSATTRAKGINVNVQLFGLLLDCTLDHRGPAATKELLLHWVNNECPIVSAASSNNSKTGGSSSSNNNTATLTANALKKRERDYYRDLAARGDKLKQRRTELFGGVVGGGGAASKSGGSGGANGRVAVELWLSERMWDVCLHFAHLVDRQLSLMSNGNNGTTPSVSAATTKATTVVWSRCVRASMASPWLTMRVVARTLSNASAVASGGSATATSAAAQSAALPIYVLGKATPTTVSTPQQQRIAYSVLSSDWSSLATLKEKFAVSNNTGNNGGTTVGAATSATTATTFELFEEDTTNATTLAAVKQQLDCVRDALNAVTTALGATTDVIAAATLALWRINLQSEEARLIAKVEVKLVMSAATSTTPAAAATNAIVDTSLLLVRESVRATITTVINNAVAATTDADGSAPNPSAAAIALSSATAQLLLRAIWFEAQQVPTSGNSTASSSKNTTAHLAHDVESFVANGTSYLPLLVCPRTMQCALVRRSTAAINNANAASSAATNGGNASSSAAQLPQLHKSLVDHDRYRVLDVLLKTLVATRGADYAIAVLQTALGTTSSSTDVAFLAPRLAACHLMMTTSSSPQAASTAARDVFDKCCASQVAALQIANPTTRSNTTAAAGTVASSVDTAGSALASTIPTASLARYKAFWASWYELEQRYGTPATSNNFASWHAKVAKVIGPVGAVTAAGASTRGY